MTAASLALLSQNVMAATADGKVKVGIIGTGLRGMSHLELLLKRDDVDVVAMCDIDAKMLSWAKDIVNKSKKKCLKYIQAVPMHGKICFQKHRLMVL